jgi:ATP-dependent protease Clp ATPase subunit
LLEGTVVNVPPKKGGRKIQIKNSVEANTQNILFIVEAF